MGLDNFSTQSGKKTRKQGKRKRKPKTDTGNTPGYAKQCFMTTETASIENPVVSPRAIKYEIKSYNCNWVTQFSSRRIQCGELVMRTGNTVVDSKDTSVAVFTTILSEFDRPDKPDNYDIWVVRWDMDSNEPLDDGIYIKYEGEWANKLRMALDRYLYNETKN